MLDGQLNVAGHGVVEAKHAVYFANDGEQITLTAQQNTRILMMSGLPINEKMVSHGPFVMNSREEIYQAFQDYQQTQFGGWPWERYDQVHDAKLGRFAKHADGRMEEPKG